MIAAKIVHNIVIVMREKRSRRKDCMQIWWMGYRVRVRDEKNHR